jgi:hypothetical protein
MTHPLDSGKRLRSYGGSFVYQILGPCSRLYDKEELPWPSCSLNWRGKQPSWNRIGHRFVPDMSASRCPSYYVQAWDQHGNTWFQVLSLYDCKLTKAEKRWWTWKGPDGRTPPETVAEMEKRLENGANW